jgi:hypothetical protein
MVEDRVNIGHDIMAVDPHDRSLGRPQRHMKGGTPFSDIDLSPRNIASRHAATPRSSASRSSSRSVSSVMRFFE